VTAGQALFLVFAGFCAGLSGSVAGLASLFSYPALLAVGLPPLAANVTNTVALISGGVGSVLGSRAELRGLGTMVRRLLPVCVLGGALGMGLLLTLPEIGFAYVVPVLIGGASAQVLLKPTIERLRGRSAVSVRRGGFLLLPVSVYGGYFGAGAAVLAIAVLDAVVHTTIARVNAMKNALMMAANGTAAVGFALFAPVSWAAALPLAVGFLGGGFTGPAIVRRAPAGVVRVLIGCAGLGLAGLLAARTWFPD
jgi:uncharacterized membrane protein YfcA